MYDIVIIGAGPAGLFAAGELSDSKLKILIIDKGKNPLERSCKITDKTVCTNCDPCDVMCGVGGAGGLSDGKLNFHPKIGGDLTKFLSEEDAWKLIEKIDEKFQHLGMKNDFLGKNQNIIEEMALKNGISFIPIKQKHIGSDKLPKLIDKFKKDLESKQIEFLVKTEVEDINIKDEKFILKTTNGTIVSKKLLCAVGRSGADWMMQQGKKLGMTMKYGPLDIGVRVEVPSLILKKITDTVWDPKFIIYTKTYDDKVRTFCTCPYGFVAKEKYKNFTAVNGYSMITKKSENTNFAFLSTVHLTEPMENTTAYGISVAKLCNTIGSGNPIIQRFIDLKEGRRSTWERIKKSHVKPTLKDVTPGDISMGMPKRIVTNMIEGLEKLNNVIPGISSSSTLLYAPEIKFYSMIYEIDKNFQTNIKNLFVAGDGAGLSRGIIGAAATGILSAKGIKDSI